MVTVVIKGSIGAKSSRVSHLARYFSSSIFLLFVTEKVREKMVVLTLLDDDETFEGKRKLIN